VGFPIEQGSGSVSLRRQGLAHFTIRQRALHFPPLPAALTAIGKFGCVVDPDPTSFFLINILVVTPRSSRGRFWRIDTNLPRTTMPVMPRGAKRPGAGKPVAPRKTFARSIEELADLIGAIAEARGVSISDVIREALEVYSRRRRPPRRAKTDRQT
jgi:hypothetical protein